MADGFQVIEKGVFDGTTSSVTFTSIPSSYSHLEISCTGNSTQTGYRGYIYVQFNGDTGSNYGLLGVDQNNGYGSPSYSSNPSSTGPAYTGLAAAADAGSGSGGDMVSSFNMWVWNYADTTFHKTWYNTSGYASGGAWVMKENGGIWRDTSAINEVRLNVYDGGGEKWVSGCQYMLGAWT